MRSSRRFDRQLAALLVCGALAVLGACSRSSNRAHQEASETTTQVGWGSVMTGVARRFEQFGRAAAAGRFDFADYELGEIEEEFETLPHASLPREGHPEVLPNLAAAFERTNLPDLARALKARDKAQTAAAFARTATACNACHNASGHGFIEVPLVEGKSVPNLEPVTP